MREVGCERASERRERDEKGWQCRASRATATSMRGAAAQWVDGWVASEMWLFEGIKDRRNKKAGISFS